MSIVLFRMKYRLYVKSIFLILCLSSCSPELSEKTAPKVINGELDLAGWDFEKDGPVKLDGDWLFKWQTLVKPQLWQGLKEEMVYTLSLPKYWHDNKDPGNSEANLPGTGYASYVLRVINIASKKSLGLQIANPNSASQFFILKENGSIIHEGNTGKVGENKDSETPSTHKYELLKLPASSLKLNSELIVLLHVSNYHYFKGGPSNNLIIGEFQQLKNSLNQANQYQDLMTGILLIIGLYHLILYLLRREDKPAMWFGLFCASMALRLFSMGVAQRGGLDDNAAIHNYLSKLEYVVMPMMVVSCSFFIHSMLSKHTFKIVSKTLFLLSIPLFLLALISTTMYFPQYLVFYQLHILIGVIALLVPLIIFALHGNSVAQMLLLSFLVITFGAVNDILHANGRIETAYIAPFTTITFILLQAALISYKNAKAYITAEYLSKKLSQEVAGQAKKINRLQFLSQEIQNTSDLDKMIQNLSHVLKKEFNISGYSFYLLDKARNLLKSLRLESVYEISPNVKDKVYKTPLDLSHPKSLHSAMIKKGKTYFLSRLLDTEISPDEKKYRDWLGIKNFFFLPLKIDGEVFAALTMSDTKFQEKDSIKFLTKEERKDIQQLSQFVSSALYQALQKEQIQKAKDEAEQAQAAASRAKNEAAVNQLAAHLAHEVNNPLNYISTGKTMQNDSFAKYHEMILGVLSGDDEETKEFKAELDNLQKKFEQGMQQTNEGQDRIAKVVAEIRAITGVDGLNFSTFDIVPIINEELVYSLHRNKIKIKEQAIKVTGTDEPIQVLSNSHILARSIRTVISNCVHFGRTHKGDDGELYIDCKVKDNQLYMDIGNNSFSIKTAELDDIFDLEKSQSYGTEQIGLAMIKELLLKVNSKLVLADHGRESGKVIFQLKVPLGS